MSGRAWCNLSLGALAFATAALALPALSPAQPVAQPAYAQGHLTGFGGDATAIPRAITRIERRGGRVLEIRFDSRLGHPGYDVVVARGGHVDFFRLAEPEAGLVVATGTSEPDWMLGWRSRKDVQVAKGATVSLADAVRRAEADNGGAPAVAAGIAASASNATSAVAAYNVLLMMPDRQVRRVAVDSRTGLVIADPQALRGWP